MHGLLMIVAFLRPHIYMQAEKEVMEVLKE